MKPELDELLLRLREESRIRRKKLVKSLSFVDFILTVVPSLESGLSFSVADIRGDVEQSRLPLESLTRDWGRLTIKCKTAVIGSVVKKLKKDGMIESCIGLGRNGRETRQFNRVCCTCGGHGQIDCNCPECECGVHDCRACGGRFAL